MTTPTATGDADPAAESHAPYKKVHPVTGCEYYLYPNVTLGENVLVYQNVLLGLPPRGKRIGELALTIGDNAVIRSSTTIYAGSTIGADFQSGHCVMMRERNTLGNNVIIGTNCVLECGNTYGDNVTFHTLSVTGNTTFESNCYIGPTSVFLDDPHPRCPSYLDCVGGATIKEWARVGGNVTVLPGVVVGRNALIGGGSTVTRDVPDHMVAAGNPARVLGDVRELKCDPELYEKPYAWLEGANL